MPSSNGSGNPARLFVLAGVFAAIGVIVFVYLLISGIADLGESLMRVQAPGAHELALDEAGAYKIYLETTGGAGGKVIDPIKQAHGLSIRVESPSGEVIPVGPVGMKETYTLGSRQGVALMKFEIKTPGQYKLIAAFAEDGPGRQLDLTISRGVFTRIMKMILLGMAVLGAAFIVAVIFVIKGALALSRRRKGQTAGKTSGMAPPIE